MDALSDGGQLAPGGTLFSVKFEVETPLVAGERLTGPNVAHLSLCVYGLYSEQQGSAGVRDLSLQ